MSNADKLIEIARRARENAHAPYSKFSVGAAVETGFVLIYAGCNIESATFGLTMCAERVAIWKALSDGARDFKAIAIVADTDELTPPCGTCRQIIWEFCGDISVTMANLAGKTETIQMSELLPRPFDSTFLNQ